MGVLEDVSTWIAWYIVKPAIDKFNEKASALEKIYSTFIDFKLRQFFYWVGTINTTVSGYIHKTVNDAIDKIEDDKGSWFPWLSDIAAAVIQTMEEMFVKVGKLTNKVLTIIADWWETAREKILDEIKDTIEDVLETAVDVMETIDKWWLDTWTIITKTIKDWVSIAVTAVSETFSNVVDALSTALADVFDSLTDAIADILGSLADLMVNVTSLIAEAETVMRTLLTDKVFEIYEYIDGVIPKVVESMFDWAKPIIQPIKDAAGWLGEIADLVTGERPKEQEIRDTEEEIERTKSDVKELVDSV